MNQRLQNDGFKPVGPPCRPLECEISLDEANNLRQAVVWDFFDNMPVKTPFLSEDADKTMAAKAYHNSYDENDDTPSLFTGAVLRHIDEESWRMIIMQTKLRRARWNNAGQRVETRYNIEVLGGQLVEAVRKVRIIRGVGELSVSAVEHQMEEDVDEGSDGGYIVVQRRAFERQVTQEDCGQIVDSLRRVARRYRS
ncbi:hypothetical protein H6796_00585 [Candidatus Nomurabacteria bacterium]|nr:hypothetical protein [Candidatus Nomurabacteria bacterium]